MSTIFQAFTKNIFNFSDRSNRSEYWGCFIINAVLSYLILFFTYRIILFNLFFSGASPYSAIAILSLFGYILCIPFIAVTARRLHDFNYSGWFTILSLIPYINFLTLIIFGCIPGTPGPNNFGYPPDYYAQYPQAPPYGYPQSPYDQQGYQQPPYPGSPPYPGQNPYYDSGPYAGAPPQPGAQPYQGQPRQPGSQPYQGQPPQPGAQPYQSQPPQPGSQPYQGQTQRPGRPSGGQPSVGGNPPDPNRSGPTK
ncbi:MAG: DUF805 domain-containing protein [Deltaproteobacteria bacterium]|nr:DUF805 domain-containing protein [Deltaproteobacteria bacterium]